MNKNCFVFLLEFNLSPSTLEIIVKRYSTRADEHSSPKISFEHYVQLCARLTMLNGLFFEREQQINE